MCDLLNIDDLAKRLGLTVYGVTERLRKARKEDSNFEDFLPKPLRRMKNEKLFWNKEAVDNWLKGD